MKRSVDCPNCDESFWHVVECTWHRIIVHGEAVNE